MPAAVAAHGAGWPSHKPSLLSRPGPSPSASALGLRSDPPPSAARPRPAKSCFERLTRPLSAPASRLRKSKSAAPTLLHHPQPVLLISPSPVRGILSKHSSLINLSSRSVSPPTSERNPQRALVVDQPPLPGAAQPSITKKVRFSGKPVESGASPAGDLSAPVACACGSPRPCRAQTQPEGAGACRQREPVIETVFLTYSRAAYDRSPIAVDRVLNQSLALPPRTGPDSPHAGRWLAERLPAPATGALPDGPRPPSARSSALDQPHPVFHPSLSEPDWHARPALAGLPWHAPSEDAASDSTSSSSSSHEPGTPAALFPPPLAPLLCAGPDCPPRPKALAPLSLAHLALHNLAPPSPGPDPLCALASSVWAPLLAPCDALDGF